MSAWSCKCAHILHNASGSGIWQWPGILVLWCCHHLQRAGRAGNSSGTFAGQLEGKLCFLPQRKGLLSSYQTSSSQWNNLISAYGQSSCALLVLHCGGSITPSMVQSHQVCLPVTVLMKDFVRFLLTQPVYRIFLSCVLYQFCHVGELVAMTNFPAGVLVNSLLMRSVFHCRPPSPLGAFSKRSLISSGKLPLFDSLQHLWEMRCQKQP